MDIVRYLIDQKADVNRGDNGGWTPLHIACGYIVNFFIVYSLMSFGHCLPASGGFDDVVRELLGAGAEVNGTNDKGITSL